LPLKPTVTRTLTVALLFLPCHLLPCFADPPVIAEKCRADLAKRLTVPAADVTVGATRPCTWPDAALGLPRQGKVYQQVVTPGWVVLLEARGTHYLYTAAETRFQYGGPLPLWQYSVLLVEPRLDEPNLNGTVVQSSVLGTNPTQLLDTASELYPQPNGALLAAARTSRSSHELLYLAPGATGAPVALAGAFLFEDAAVNSGGTEWLALAWDRVGGTTQVVGGTVGGARDDHWTVDLPGDVAGERRLHWDLDRPVLEGGQGKSFHELTAEKVWTKLAHYWPVATDLMLNKSEKLVIKQVTVDEKPGTAVVREWFTGDEKPVASLPGFVSAETTVTPEKRFVFLQGKQDGNSAAYMVDVDTGETISVDSGPRGNARLFLAPPREWTALLKLIGE